MKQETALEILKTGVNVFLTGEPGSGKTHTVNAYVRWLREHGVAPAITASTGIAATHINGMTIHSWCGIGIKKSISSHDLDAIADNERVARRVCNANVLIIDEVSMLSAPTLSMAESVCRKLRRQDKPFGGLQVVLVGDFFQLPPVVTREESGSAQLDLEEDTAAKILVPFAFRSRAWESANLVVCYLTEQHRQEDTALLELLSLVRSGTTDEHAQTALATRRVDEHQTPWDLPRLYSHNSNVDQMNDARLASIPGMAKTYHMTSRGSERLVATLQRGCLSPEELTLKVGARVMFTKNSPDGSFVNGTIGEVQSFTDEGMPIVKTLRGRRVFVEPMEWAITDGVRVLARIAQLPLRLAWAITIHKSQGMTLDAAVMDLSQAFEYGQGYVALSRVRSLAGLHLLGWNERSLQVHPEVIAQDQDFKQRSAKAQAKFADMPKAEQASLVRKFVINCGGKPEGGVMIDEKKSAARGSTYQTTLELVKSGKAIPDIAKIRSLTEGTITSHILRLHADGRLTSAELEPHVSPALKHALPKIQAAFQKLGLEHLSPVFNELNGAYSYDDLRLARALLE
jgi:ATP-dependent DNA helicase PIF1